MYTLGGFGRVRTPLAWASRTGAGLHMAAVADSLGNLLQPTGIDLDSN